MSSVSTMHLTCGGVYDAVHGTGILLVLPPAVVFGHHHVLPAKHAVSAGVEDVGLERILTQILWVCGTIIHSLSATRATGEMFAVVSERVFALMCV